MPKLRFTQKKGKRKGKAGADSAAPKKRAKRAPAGEDAAGSKGNAPRLGSEPQRFFPEKEFKGARLGYYFAMGKYGLGYYLDAPEPEPTRCTPEASDVFDKVLGNQELLERIMLFLPTPGDLGRIASVNKLFKAASTSMTLWDARYKHYPTLTLENTKLDKLKLYHRTGKFMKALLFLVDDDDEDDDREMPWDHDDFNPCSEKDLEELTKEYLKFMTIRRDARYNWYSPVHTSTSSYNPSDTTQYTAKSDLLFQPSPFVDQVWHAHILNTHDYKAFCKQVFGHFVHHIPGEVHLPNGGFAVYDYELTLEAYEGRFGKPGEGLMNPMIWPSLEMMKEYCYDEGCGCG